MPNEAYDSTNITNKYTKFIKITPLNEWSLDLEKTYNPILRTTNYENMMSLLIYQFLMLTAHFHLLLFDKCMYFQAWLYLIEKCHH